jgi:ribosomal protein L11 methyltransferase
MSNWLEVSMVVNGELAEAVAEVLGRFAPNGVMTEQGIKFVNDEDEGTPNGPITVRAYLRMDEEIEETRRRLEESLFYLGMIQSLPPPTFTTIADQNWMEAWKQHYRPIPIGKGLVILPAWSERLMEERVAIRIDPGMAFGTGTHPSTQLCLEFIEQMVHGTRPDLGSSKVIDVGCGSGILSIAALKLGAKQALAVDIDPESIQNAHHNAQLNQIGEELILGTGSVQDILEGKFPLRRAGLVVANILAPVIVRLLGSGLADLVEAGGALILSGILQEQTQSVIDAAQSKGLKMREQRAMQDWVALRLEF